MKYFRLSCLNKPFFIITIGFYISVYFNIKLIINNRCDDTSQKYYFDKHVLKKQNHLFKTQDFKNAKIVIQNGDYFIPANVINGTENFGVFKKLNFLSHKIARNNPCKYALNIPRIICAVFTHKEAHDDVKFIQNTWGRRLV
jgi:hypothetical protein